MIAIRDLPHVLAVINAATIVVLLRAYSRIRARDREGHRRTMFVAIGLGVAFLAVYLVYHAFAGLAKFGGYGADPADLFHAARNSRVHGVRGRGARAGDLLQRAQAAVRHAQAARALHVAGVAVRRGLRPRRLCDGGPSLSDERQLTARMTETAQTVTSLNRARSAAGVKGAVQRELIGWAWLAVGALAVAGVFALLLALSRIPGMEKTPFWPIDFFYKGLVIHVVFSLVIWLQGVFAFLVSVATLKLAGDDVRAAPLGRIGQGAVLLAFPCLFAPAFLEATQPALTNYIPHHSPSGLRPRLDRAGVGRAGAGCSSVRSICRDGSLPRRRSPLAMALGGFVYVLALDLFCRRHDAARACRASLASREELFWGGGHVLQFVYAALMVTNWSLLARMSLGEKAVDSRVFLASVALIALIAVAGAGVLRDFRSLLRPISARRSGFCSLASPRRR